MVWREDRRRGKKENETYVSTEQGKIKRKKKVNEGRMQGGKL